MIMMKYARALLLALPFLASTPFTATAFASTDKDDSDVQTVAGWVEHVTLPNHERKLKARLDTGAKTSSIYAKDVDMDERDGDRWVTFTVPGDEDGDDLKLEKKVRRVVRIKRGDDEYDRRYVVDMEVCFNGSIHETQFSLADRSHLNYPMLLGRRFLDDVALVHSGKSYITDPGCGDGSNG